MLVEKECTKCKEIKDIQLFGKNKKSKDGYLTICKLCRKYIQREYKLKNKEKRKNRTRSNHEKVSNRIRSRVRGAFKSVNLNKCISLSELLGCSIEFFKEYIESKFTKGMTWENWDLYGWHLDHIIPCSSFDLSDLEQQKQCFHYTNTQPLWATKEIAMKYGEDNNYIGNLEKSKNDYRK